MRISEIDKTYKGSAIETGGTSIKGQGPSPYITKLIKQNKFVEKTVLDYGAGKYGRNAEAIRNAGGKVFAYDPYNGEIGVSGWEGVSNTLPSVDQTFDIAFTSYVLNVLPENIEDKIIKEIQSYSNEIFHITRNMDIYDTVKNALSRKDKTVSNFFLTHFANEKQKEDFQENNLSKETILDFCYHGVKTSRGFQRIPKLEDKGYTLIEKTYKHKVYKSTG